MANTVWNLEYSVLSFLPPFTGKTTKVGRERTLKLPRGLSGVYLIKEDDKLVCVGMSGFCVWYTLYRHFNVWVDKRKGKKGGPNEYGISRVSYEPFLEAFNYEVAIFLTKDKQAALELEKHLILKYMPRDNRMKYDHFILSHDYKIIAKTDITEEFDEEQYYTKNLYGYNSTIGDEAPF